MEIGAYLIFPEEFTREDYAKSEYLEAICKQLIAINEQLRPFKHDSDKTLFYSTANISGYEKLMTDMGANIDAFKKLRAILGSSAIDIDRQNNVNHAICYTSWMSQGQCVANFTCDIIKKMSENAKDNNCVLSFAEDYPLATWRFGVIRDNENDDSLPIFSKFQLVFSAADFAEWFKAFVSGEFSLRNTTYFERTCLVESGAVVYRNKQDRSLWYADLFHQNIGRPHYEVFGSDNKFLYEANYDSGERIPGSYDKHKDRTLNF